MKPILFVLSIVVLTLIGDYLLKLASARPAPLATWQFAAGAIVYGSSAVGWVYAMKYMSLAGIGVAYSMLVIIFLAIMGMTLFDEKLAPREILGLTLACVSLGLMSRLH